MNDLELAVNMVRIPCNGRDVTACGKEYFYDILTKIDAGLTYIGQMISHDIVLPTNIEHRHRVVTGRLELDSLFGPLPEQTDGSVAGEQSLFNPSGRFLLSGLKGQDLYRDAHGKALILEQRNDENTIISQLHNVWLRLHNFLLNKGYATNPLEARRLVTLTFQLVVVEDFLKSFLNPKVYCHFFIQNMGDILPYEPTIPDYFSKASFRFGHSSVRRDYHLKPVDIIRRKSHKKPLTDLFRRDKPLINDFEIDWRMFFSWNNNQDAEPKPQPETQSSLGIDTLVTPLMSVVPLRVDPSIHIAAANLKAARDISLPLGRQFADQYSNYDFIEPLTSTVGSRVDVVDSIEDLPLWPYILLEAQQKQDGLCLGGLGSLLNAQVLRTSMSQAKYSIFETTAPNGTQPRSYEYDLERVLTSMGTLGEYLTETMPQYKHKISMYSIIKLITE